MHILIINEDSNVKHKFLKTEILYVIADVYSLFLIKRLLAISERV